MDRLRRLLSSFMAAASIASLAFVVVLWPGVVRADEDPMSISLIMLPNFCTCSPCDPSLCAGTKAINVGTGSYGTIYMCPAKCPGACGYISGCDPTCSCQSYISNLGPACSCQ